MFRYTPVLQNTAKPSKPDALYAMKLQELLGGQFGELTVTMQYLFQGFNCRMPGKYKDMIMDIATEEIGHVEMIATMVARLLEGAPGEATEKAAEKAAATSPVMAAVLGGMNPQHAIVAGGGAVPKDSAGNPWNAGYIVASGNLLADFRSNASAEAQGRLQTSRLYGMTDDPGVKSMLAFNLARDTFHQQQWLLGVQNLIDDGLSDVIEHSHADVEDKVHDHTFWSFIDGPSKAAEGLWATGSTLVDGGQPIDFLEEPARLTDDDGLLPAPDPLLFGTYDGDQGPGAPGTATGSRAGGVAAKIKDALT